MCVFLEIGQKFFWSEITNFDQLMAENATLVNLWLRNGEYLYTHITGGKDLKVINMSYL